MNDEINEVKAMWRAEKTATHLGLSRAALYEAVRRGLIPAVRLGRRLRFDPAAIETWKANGGTANTKVGG